MGWPEGGGRTRDGAGPDPRLYHDERIHKPGKTYGGGRPVPADQLGADTVAWALAARRLGRARPVPLATHVLEGGAPRGSYITNLELARCGGDLGQSEARRRLVCGVAGRGAGSVLHG